MGVLAAAADVAVTVAAVRAALLVAGEENVLLENDEMTVDWIQRLARSCRRHPLNRGLSKRGALHSSSVTPSRRDVSHCLHHKRYI